jgi:hypothetical protein
MNNFSFSFILLFPKVSLAFPQDISVKVAVFSFRSYEKKQLFLCC